jgi:polyisoprenoid-binding protein YceI
MNDSQPHQGLDAVDREQGMNLMRRFAPMLICCLPGLLAAQSASRPQTSGTSLAPMLHLMLAPAGNTARFIVREQLLSAELPNDAVGTTSAVSGGILIHADGTVDTATSQFTVLLDSLTTDKKNRDKYIKEKTLETAQYPTARLVVRQVRGLPTPLPASGTMTLTIVGDLTIHGVTRPTTWQATATERNGVFTGTAMTHVNFEEFGMERPRLMLVVSIVDDIRLEYDFDLVPPAVSQP